MSQINYVDDTIQIDADVLAQAFNISAEDLRRKMCEGAITSRSEKGEGDDAGKVRLTFFSADRRIRIVADERGNVLTCSAADFRKPLTRPSLAVSRTKAASAGNAGGGTEDASRPGNVAAGESDAARRLRLDALLDAALSDTFPASDPVAISFGSGR